MGTGTSHGVPVIACECAVCTSSDPRDKRLRSSVHITNEHEGKNYSIVIDVGPEFRIQALKYKIKSLDAVLLTHGHADHLHGLDDVRIFSHTKLESLYGKSGKNLETSGNGMPVYANETTLNTIRSAFSYIFMETQIGGGKPKIDLYDTCSMTADNPLKFGGMEFISIPMLHGKLPVSGFLISVYAADGRKHSIAYLTDCSFISEESAIIIRKNAGILDHVVIDGLREKEHTTHFNFIQAMDFAACLYPEHIWLTHITHDSSHESIIRYVGEYADRNESLKEIVKKGGTVAPAYDGLSFEIGF